MSFEIPGVLWRRDPQGEELPLVFDSPHSGTHYPEDFRYCCPFPVLRTTEDAHVDALYARAPEFGATLIAALFPRCYIDPNRALDDIDPALFEGPWPSPLAPSHKTRAGLGLVRRLVRPGIPIYEGRLARADILARIERCHIPYHRTLEEALARLHRRFGAVWHVNCHSMPSTRSPAMRGKGRSLHADFVLGDRDGTTCARDFTDFVARVLRGRGYSVRVNEVYKGVEIVRRHGRPREHRHSLQIEIDRALYMDQKTIEKSAGFAEVEADIGRLIAALAEFARERLARHRPELSTETL